MQHEDSRHDTFTSSAGRDAGKTFRINEAPPLATATLVLQVLAALAQDSVYRLTELFTPRSGSDGEPADFAPVLRVLTGCDPMAVRAVLTEALSYVEVAPDPRSPGMFRPVDPTLDIREMATLGELVTRFVRLNMGAG